MKKKIIEQIKFATERDGFIKLSECVMGIGALNRLSHMESALIIDKLVKEGKLELHDGFISVAHSPCSCGNEEDTFFQNHGSCEWCYFIGDEVLN